MTCHAAFAGVAIASPNRDPRLYQTWGRATCPYRHSGSSPPETAELPRPKRYIVSSAHVKPRLRQDRSTTTTNRVGKHVFLVKDRPQYV